MNRIKAILLTGLFLISLIPSVLASGDYTIETIPNVRLANRTDHVSNPDQIITATDVTRINQILNMVEDSLGIEVAVVAVNSIGENDARMFATDLFKHWGLGKRSKDNGLLIQLVTEPVQRSVVFETGYGLEGILPDAICYRLQQRYMMPDLKAGDYSAGMLKGVAAVAQYLMTSDYERAAMTGNQPSANNHDLPVWIVIIFSVGALGLVAFVGYLKYRPRICPRCGKKTYAYTGKHTVVQATYQSEGMAEEIYRCKSCGYTHKETHRIDRLRRGGGGSGPIFMGGGGLGGFGGGGGGGGSWGGGRSGGGGSISRF